MFCEKCGNQMSADAKFCSICGSEQKIPGQSEPSSESTVAMLEKLNKGGSLGSLGDLFIKHKRLIVAVITGLILCLALVIIYGATASKLDKAKALVDDYAYYTGKYFEALQGNSDTTDEDAFEAMVEEASKAEEKSEEIMAELTTVSESLSEDEQAELNEYFAEQLDPYI